MGIFDLIGDVLDVAEKTVTTGVSVVADVVTLGEREGDTSYTEDAVDKLAESLDKLIGG